jgi:hypothetical protein
MTTPTSEAQVSDVAAELNKLVGFGAIEYYLPTIPEGEQFIIGLKGRILKMDIEQAICFLAGTTAVAELLAKRAGLRL